MTIFFIPYFVLYWVQCTRSHSYFARIGHVRVELWKKCFFPVKCHRIVINQIVFFFVSREKTDNRTSYFSYFEWNSNGTQHWNFYSYFWKVFDLSFLFLAPNISHLFHLIEKFFSMLVKLCNVFYRPRPLFMVTDPFLFTLCIKLTQHKHLPFQWIIKNGICFYNIKICSKNFFSSNHFVLNGMRYGMKSARPINCVYARCVTEEKKNRATMSLRLLYYTHYMCIRYVCFRRTFSWNSKEYKWYILFVAWLRPLHSFWNDNLDVTFHGSFIWQMRTRTKPRFFAFRLC